MAQIELFNTSLFNDANLIGYWRMEGNSNDSKGSANGSDTSITYNTGNGKFGQGAGFNGSSSQINFNAAILQSTFFTVSAWVKFSSNPAAETSVWRIFDYSGSSNYAGVALDIDTGGHALIMSGANTGRTQGTHWQRAVGNTVLSDGNYHMITGTYDGSNLRIYVDGVLDATAVSWTTAPNISAGGILARFGVQKDSADRFYTGATDDLAYFNRALTATEISNLFIGSGISDETAYLM